MPLDELPAIRLETRLKHEIRGEVLFDAFSRGRYATDASIYQIEPIGVVVPRSRDDAAAAIEIAREKRVPVLLHRGRWNSCRQIGRTQRPLY
jgi:FAD/FMN-containing dehydrogenase